MVTYTNKVNNIQKNAVNFAINLQNTIINENILPANCTLRPFTESLNNCVVVDFVLPNSELSGHVLLSMCHDNGFVEILGAINNFNGYFLETTVDSLEEMYGVIAFCQYLLQFQPNQYILDYVRIPPHMINHWCVSAHLRELNMGHTNNQNLMDQGI